MKCFKKNFVGKIPKIAFEKSIKMMKNLYFYRKPIDKLLLTTKMRMYPIDKLLLTTKMRMYIFEEIKEFWEQVPEEMNKKELKLEIDIDDYINIFEYIIIKSGMNDLIVHIEFIEAFTTEKTRKNIDDYNLQQIKVGLMQLNDLKENEKIIKY